MATFTHILKLFRLRVVEMQVYEELFSLESAHASEIAKRVGVSRTAVYDLLDTLLEKGLITETTQGGVKTFAVQPPEKLELLIIEKKKGIKNALAQLEQLKREHSKKPASQKPRLQMFEGKEELKQMMKDMLLYRDIEVLAYWPVKKIISLLGTEFMANFHKQRVAQNIKLKVIWPSSQIPKIGKHPFLKTGAELRREARSAPAGMDFSLGYSIYGNTVRFISSSKESFGFLVESPELADMLRKQFTVFWKIGKPVKR